MLITLEALCKSFLAPFQPTKPKAPETQETSSNQGRIADLTYDCIKYIPRCLSEPFIRTIMLPKTNSIALALFTGLEFSADMHDCFSRTWSKKRFHKVPIDMNHWHQKLSGKDHVLEKYAHSEVKLQPINDVTLHGDLFLHPNSGDPNARIMIVFGGNVELHQSGATLACLINNLHDHETPVSLIAFNLRGCGKSSGLATRKGIMADLEVMYEHAKTLVEGDESRVDIYGHSFGGALAAQLKSKHGDTGGLCFINGTFSDTSVVGPAYMKKKFGDTGFVRTAASVLIHCSKHYADWRIDNTGTLGKIKDRTFVFYHRDDLTVPYKASLAYRFVENQDQAPENVRFHEVVTPKDTNMAYTDHLMPLDELTLAITNKPAFSVITDALKA